MINLENLTMGYSRHTLLKEASADIRSNALTALIGRNGSGKSTLLRAIAGLNSDYKGQIKVENEDMKGISTARLSRLISFVSTRRIRIRNMKCLDVVLMGRSPYTDWIGKVNRNDKDIARKSLEDVGMEEFANREIDTLSDGEFQRIMIARALAQSTPVILLDEPTSFLDLPSRYELSDLLSLLAHNEGKTILFSTHELDIAIAKADGILLISDEKLYHLPSNDIETSYLIRNKFGIRNLGIF